MPALAPLLASEAEIPGSPIGEVTKKIPRKLRRKNPPPSLSTNHQKLPSATSSTVSLPKSRPSSSRSTKPPSGGGWFSRAAITGGRKSMDTSRNSPAKDEWLAEEFRDIPDLPCDIGLGSNVGHGGVLTPPGSPMTIQGSMQHYIGMDPGPPNLPSTARFGGAPGKSMVRPNSSGGGSPNGFSSLPPPPIPPRPDSLVFKSSNEQNGIKKLSETKPKARSVPIDNEFLLPPTAPFAGSPSSSEQPPRSSNGSPVLPPLPSFRSGDFGFVTAPSSISSRDSLRSEVEKPPLSPKHPGRKAHSRSSSRSPPRSEITQPAPKTTPPSPLRPYTPPESSVDPAVDFDFTFHAVTAEEPIVLPSTSSTQSSNASPSGSPLPVQPEAKKKERRGSFLGGWKLAMKRASGTETGRDTPINDPPVGVGSGGGWIYRRRGSFSSPRPPSAEKMQHKTYAQEYKEFRQSKGNNSSVSLKSSTTDPAAPATAVPATASTFAARAAAAGIQPSTQQQPEPPQPPQQELTRHASAPVSSVKPSRSTRKNFREKMKSVEARFIQKHPPPAPPSIIGKEIDEKELVGLDVAVRQMGLLEEQLKSGRPLSPPDSREGEKSKENEKQQQQQNQHDIPVAPLTIVKTNSSVNSFKEEEKSPIPTPTSSPGVGVGRNIAPPPSNHTKTKSLSPLRNQVDTSSPPSPKIDKGKAKEGDGSIVSSKHSSSSIYPPPSEYLGKSRTSSGGVSRPPTPPKPVAKLFVICCRCKYWHDLPSAMYRAMVENGGATRCPYCLHGMETACCSGYTCVVYMHQRHH
ncbi:hypothetical protein K440DRAFT_187445 [Wilcoxina mikolae CBS 423.85]|nr:hypothetical protein K440DRAFT_187445 [Wilcoxina mikolae CBS 423.85]